jgi:allophanate hydrolase subunit 2
MALEVLDLGPSTTVQDFGRPGHGACGVAEGGAMDRELLAAVNRAAGNRPRAAGLESPSKDRNCVGGAVAVSGSRSGLTRSGR